MPRPDGDVQSHSDKGNASLSIMTGEQVAIEATPGLNTTTEEEDDASDNTHSESDEAEHATSQTVFTPLQDVKPDTAFVLHPAPQHKIATADTPLDADAPNTTDDASTSEMVVASAITKKPEHARHDRAALASATFTTETKTSHADADENAASFDAGVAHQTIQKPDPADTQSSLIAKTETETQTHIFTPQSDHQPLQNHHEAMALQGIASPLPLAPNSATTPQPSALTALNPPDASTSHSVPYLSLPIEIGLRTLDGAREISLNLTPQELGHLDIVISVRHETPIHVSFVAEQPQTLALLQQDASHIRHALEQAGFSTHESSLQFSLQNNMFSNSNSSHGEQKKFAGRRPGISGDRPLESEPIEATRSRYHFSQLDLSI